MAERYDLVVFDWDGTVVDSPGAIVECMRLANLELGLPEPDPRVASHVIGLGPWESIRLLAPDLPTERYREYSAAYSRHFLRQEERMRLFDGMAGVLAELRARGHRLGVATGKSRRGLDRSLDSTGTRHFFEATRCADETRPKPDPEMLLQLMHELGVAPARTLMVGDTSHDLEMARHAGVDALAVAYGAHPRDGLIACAPEGCVGSIGELRQWLINHA